MPVSARQDGPQFPLRPYTRERPAEEFQVASAVLRAEIPGSRTEKERTVTFDLAPGETIGGAEVVEFDRSNLTYYGLVDGPKIEDSKVYYKIAMANNNGLFGPGGHVKVKVRATVRSLLQLVGSECEETPERGYPSRHCTALEGVFRGDLTACLRRGK
jgi:hypothetical protein